LEILSPSTVATGSVSSKLAEPSRSAGVGLAAGGDSAGVAAAGVEAGVAAGGVEAGVAAAGVEAGVAAGFGVPAGSGAAAGWDGLHEERNATAAAKVSTMEDALFISKEAFLRTRGNSTPVESYIFRFTASDSRVIVTVQSAHVAELADACASGAHGVTLGGSNPLVSTAPILRFSDMKIFTTEDPGNTAKGDLNPLW